MTMIRKPWIKIRETLDQEDYQHIHELQELCLRADQTALKLELDYKLGAAQTEAKHAGIQQLNEFMYFDDQQLIGYIGICSFGGIGSQIEVNGMVHPDYRQQGVFRQLLTLVHEEWSRRDAKSMLLLCDRKSIAGQRICQGTGARLDHSEYEMVLDQEHFEQLPSMKREITFRKATNGDAQEISRQNEIYFGDEPDLILPEDEEARGIMIYLAEKDQRNIGKVHLQLLSQVGGIYGLGVLPEHRGKGFGRMVLCMAVEKLIEAKASSINLQVATENANALHLYKSCGFIETSTMDYYELKKEAGKD